MVTLEEMFYAVTLFIWVVVVVQVISKAVYEFTWRRYGDEYVGMYFARKVIHMLAGGLVALLVALLGLFKSPIMPFILGMVLALFCYIPHRRGKLMYWFQDPKNTYEVNFCIFWSVVMSLGWFLSDGGWWLGGVPVLFMAFGDGITGIVRNFIFKKRTKHWIGNLAMFVLCAPMGYFIGPFFFAGVLAAFSASLIEHIDNIGGFYLDDNILIPLTSFTILALFTILNAPYMWPIA